MNGSRLDDIDYKIIELLGVDARKSNRQIAAEIGVTEGTVRARLKSLHTAGLIQFTVVTDFRLAGSPNLVVFGVHAEPQRVRTLAEQLAEIDEIGSVMILLGRYNLMALGLFTSMEEVYELVRTRIKPLPGVRRVNTSVSIHNMKYDVRMARITARSAARQPVAEIDRGVEADMYLDDPETEEDASAELG